MPIKEYYHLIRVGGSEYLSTSAAMPLAGFEAFGGEGGHKPVVIQDANLGENMSHKKERFGYGHKATPASLHPCLTDA